MEGLEIKQLNTDNKIEQIFKKLDNQITPNQGIFFEGQLFDAHVFVSSLIKMAEKSIIVVDNYIDETTLLMLSKRNDNVNCRVLTRINKALKNDLEKHNKQYPPIELIENTASHDRFIIIDNEHLYHFGASLKDVGKKCFAFNKMDSLISDIQSKLLQIPQ
jgi:hypothetical protein